MKENSVYMKYRPIDKKYELHDIDTNISYWFIKKGNRFIFDHKTIYPK